MPKGNGDMFMSGMFPQILQCQEHGECRKAMETGLFPTR